jgi:hypothetical protein
LPLDVITQRKQAQNAHEKLTVAKCIRKSALYRTQT